MTRHFVPVLIMLIILTCTRQSKAQYQVMSGSVDSNGWKQTSSKVQTVTFCDLVRGSTDYDQKIIRVRAILVENHVATVDGGESYFYDPNCYSEDTSMLVEGGVVHSNPKIDQILRRLRSQRAEHGYSRVKVVAVGRFDAPKGTRYGHLDHFRSRFVVRSIEHAEPVAFRTPWPWQLKGDAPISRAEQAIKELNNEFMFFYAGGRNEFPARDLLADDFSFIDNVGEVKDKGQFIEAVTSSSFMGTIENSDIKVLVSRSSAVVTGLMMKSKGNTREHYRYKTRFMKLRGRWQVVSLEVLPETTTGIKLKRAVRTISAYVAHTFMFCPLSTA